MNASKLSSVRKQTQLSEESNLEGTLQLSILRNEFLATLQ